MDLNELTKDLRAVFDITGILSNSAIYIFIEEASRALL